jgi:hypothetical protein
LNPAGWRTEVVLWDCPPDSPLPRFRYAAVVVFESVRRVFVQRGGTASPGRAHGSGKRYGNNVNNRFDTFSFNCFDNGRDNSRHNRLVTGGRERRGAAGPGCCGWPTDGA